MKKFSLWALLIIGLIVFGFNTFGAAVTGSYIINEENISNYLIFSENKDDISQIDKYLYSFHVSIYPYLAILGLLLTIIMIFSLIKLKK